jgi:hypothetical protein
VTENLKAMPEIGAAAERYERLKKGRDLVRRTALLLSAELPLPELIGQLAAETGDFARATRLLGYADEAYRKTGNEREPAERHGYERTFELIREALTDERIATQLSEGAAMEQGTAVAEALAIPQPRRSQASSA